MTVLKLTSPDGMPVVIAAGDATTLMITPSMIRPQGEFIVGKTQMIDGSKIFNGQQHAIVVESVDRIFDLLTKKPTQPPKPKQDSSSAYQIASDQ